MVVNIGESIFGRIEGPKKADTGGVPPLKLERPVRRIRAGALSMFCIPIGIDWRDVFHFLEGLRGEIAVTGNGHEAPNQCMRSGGYTAEGSASKAGSSLRG